MSGFKLLAIRPLEGCDPRFRKNLKEGEIYQFYQNYDFIIDIKGEKKSTKNLKLDEYKSETNILVKAPDNEIDLYSDGDLKINLSVTLGENGSGKSTIIDLICFLSFTVFKDYPRIFKTAISKLKKDKKQLETICKDSVDILKSNRSFDFRYFPYRSLEHFFEVTQKLNYLKGLDLKNEFSGFKCEYYFFLDRLKIGNQTFNKSVIKITASNGDFNIEILNEEKWEVKHLSNLQSFKSTFFYTILLNYSVYSYRKQIYGEWIEHLYHKNDGYRTPLVINPMKTNGNIEINNEIALQKNRMLISIFRSPKILDKTVESLNFTLSSQDDNFNYIIDLNLDLISREYKKDLSLPSDFLFIVDEKTINAKQITPKDLVFLKLSNKDKFSNFEIALLKYILRKFVKYQSNFNEINEKETLVFNNFNKWFSYVNANNTFKEKKIRSALLLLRSNEYKFDFIETDNGSFVLNFDEYSSFFDKIKDYNFNEQNPLSFLKFDFEFDDKSKLDNMSSGQLQLLNSMNSIYYHLINLDSDNHSYKYANVILDEVELYLHPEFQRMYIKTLIEGIKNLGLKRIKDINIVILSHSPFILSDVPLQNILHLQNGERAKINRTTNTFGANIHDLLANDFFLENGFMGEFAKEKIESIIMGLTILINQKEIEKITNQYKFQPLPVYVEIKLRHLKEELEFLKKQNKAIVTEAEINGILDLIGEPVLKKKIEQMKKIAFPS